MNRTFILKPANFIGSARWSGVAGALNRLRICAALLAAAVALPAIQGCGGGVNHPTNAANSQTPVVSGDPVMVAAGYYASCALFSSGGVKCWGDHNGPEEPAPYTLPGITGSDFIEIVNDKFCATLSGGRISCTSAYFRDAIKVPDLTSVAGVAIGGSHYCALMEGGGVKCWGNNFYGQLGDGTLNDSSEPVDVVGIAGAKGISAGSYHTCVVLSNGGVKCWGYNSQGQLGDGTANNASIPVDATGMSDAIAIEAYNTLTCAITNDGQMECWGEGLFLSGRQPIYWFNANTPTPIEGMSDIKHIASGFGHLCVTRNNGTMKCLGDNSYGQLGDGSFDSTISPVDVIGVSNAVGVAVGGDHTCALLSGGAIQCWGDNSSGQIDGAPKFSLLPTLVPGVTGTEKICNILAI